MSLPEPKIGAVIRYSFLWNEHAKKGQEEGDKDRPAAIVVTKRHVETGETRVSVVPITHTEPEDHETSFKVPGAIAKRLGLDDEPQWFRLDQVNRFLWPGYDLRHIPGRAGEYVYGELPKELFVELIDRMIALDKAKKLKVTERT